MIDGYPHGDLGTEHLREGTEAAVVMLRVMRMLMLVVIVVLLTKVLPIFDEVYQSFTE